MPKDPVLIDPEDDPARRPSDLSQAEREDLGLTPYRPGWFDHLNELERYRQQAMARGEEFWR